MFEEANGETWVEIPPTLNTLLMNHLRSGLPIVVYDYDGLEFDAVAKFDERIQAWIGVPDWSTRRDLPPSHEK
jgi:hypothetical protein